MLRNLLILACLVGCLAAAEPPVATEPVAAAPADYRTQAGDLLRIRVFDHEDLALEVRIPATGGFDFPLIGSITTGQGRTLSELGDEIRTRLQDGYLRRAEVNILVLEFAPRIVSVVGAVKQPQAIHIHPYEHLTAVQAVGKAGGIADPGAGAAVLVLRLVGDAGHWQPLPVPAEAFTGGKGDVVLQPGDQVVVPRVDKVYVMGEVGRPGAVENPSDGSPLTLSKAIALSGGFARFAKQSAVSIYRGGKRHQTIDLMRALAAGGDGDPLLEPGDTVFVPASRL